VGIRKVSLGGSSHIRHPLRSGSKGRGEEGQFGKWVLGGFCFNTWVLGTPSTHIYSPSIRLKQILETQKFLEVAIYPPSLPPRGACTVVNWLTDFAVCASKERQLVRGTVHRPFGALVFHSKKQVL
jgi:hypothetical protein